MYTYPEALNALQGIASDFMRTMRPNVYAPVNVVCDVNTTTASVSWDNHGAQIYLPIRPATSMMTQGEFEDWTAYLLHELGHPTHTDKAVWTHAVNLGLGQLTNAVEDVRMEKALIASGVAHNAKAVLSRLISRKVVEARATDWKPNSRKAIGWTICVLGRVANGYDIDPADVAWINSQIKPGSTVAKVLDWALPELAQCSNTAACLNLAKKISQAIAEPQKPADRPSETGQSKGEGKGETSQQPAQGQPAPSPDKGEQGEGAQGAGEGEGEGEDAGEDNAGEDNEDEQGEGAGTALGGKGHGDGTNNADDPIETDETPVTDERDLDKTDLAPIGHEAPMVAGRHVEKAVLDILRENAQHDGKPAGHMQDDYASGRAIGAPILKENAAKASKQRALLSRALRANEQDEREGGRRSGKLDRGALSRAMAGSPNVFSRHDVSEGFDTDVHVLVDASSSMSGRRMYRAVEAALVAAQAAAMVGASCTVEAFNSNGFIRAGRVASKTQPVLNAFAKLHGMARGGTPLSAHIARASLAQAKRATAKRRVLFVITDGACDYGTAVVKRTVDYCEKACGTVFAHVSIDTSLQGAFRAEVRVEAHQSVASVGLQHFVRVLQAL